MADAPAIRRGRLSSADHDAINALAEQGLGSGRIARQLGLHQGAVQWFMYRTGLRAPGYGNSTAHVRRNGRPVKPFSPEEDRFITELRLAGSGPAEIARRTTAEFGHPRSSCTVANRLVMLASREEAA